MRPRVPGKTSAGRVHWRRFRKPAAQELRLRAVVDGLGEMLGAQLVAPRVVDDEPARVLTEIDVGVVAVVRGGDAVAKIIRQVRGADDPVFHRGPEHGG